MPDMIDLSQVQIINAPLDIASWPIARSITRLTMKPSGDSQAGLAFDFDAPLPESWKWFTGAGQDNFQYTVWAGAVVNGQPVLSAFIQMWQGRPSTGAPILTDFHANWAYSSRWGLLHNYLPRVGDVMGFMVSAGNARDQRGVTSVRERSNLVTLSLPSGDARVFDYTLPEPVPVPTPTPTPTPAPSDLALRVGIVEAKLKAIASLLA